MMLIRIRITPVRLKKRPLRLSKKKKTKNDDITSSVKSVRFDDITSSVKSVKFRDDQEDDTKKEHRAEKPKPKRNPSSSDDLLFTPSVHNTISRAFNRFGGDGGPNSFSEKLRARRKNKVKRGYDELSAGSRRQIDELLRAAEMGTDEASRMLESITAGSSKNNKKKKKSSAWWKWNNHNKGGDKNKNKNNNIGRACWRVVLPVLLFVAVVVAIGVTVALTTTTTASSSANPSTSSSYSSFGAPPMPLSSSSSSYSKTLSYEDNGGDHPSFPAEAAATTTTFLKSLSHDGDAATDRSPTTTKEKKRKVAALHQFKEALEGIVGHHKMYDETTHEYETLVWLANDDPLRLDVTTTPLHVVLQRFAIANLYFATNGNGWVCGGLDDSFGDRFLSEKDVCDWNDGGGNNDDGGDEESSSTTNKKKTGILCEEKRNYYGSTMVVTEIHLGDCRLDGTIPNSIRILSGVKSFNISSNELVGSIPDSIGMISSLTNLDMSTNYLFGEIPKSFDRLLELKILNLSHNNLFGGDGGKALRHLPNLEEVNLSHNHLKGHIGHLGTSESLRNVDLSSNLMHGTFPNGFGVGKNLQYLDLSDNRITGFVPKTIGNLKSLVKLDLSYNQLSGSLPTNLRNMLATRVLILDENNDVQNE